MDHVRIGTCSGPADAALIRSAFAAYEIPIFIGAEHHAGLLGGLGGSFVSLDIWVAQEDAEQALDLLHELRNGVDPDEVEAFAAEPQVTDDTSDRALDASEPSGDATMLERTKRRRGTAIVLLLGACVTFGTAHMYTGAWMRGLALAGCEVISFKYLAVRPAMGLAILVGTVLIDILGALWRVHSGGVVPKARVHR